MERFIHEGDEFYDAAIEAISGARRSVAMEMYIFQDDAVGRRFAEALAERAVAGIKVLVIYDRIGCIGTPERFWMRLREAGARVLPYHPWRGLHDFLRFFFGRLMLAFFRRNHRKTLVVDERIGFTGGFNIMNECSLREFGRERWLDAVYMTETPMLVRGLLTHFRDSLRRISGTRDIPRSLYKRTREAILYPPGAVRGLTGAVSGVGAARDGSGAVQRVAGMLERRRRHRRARKARRRLPPQMTIVRALKKLMHASRRRIWLTYPYFVPYGGVMRRMLRKAKADPAVDVRVYLSIVSDLPWMRDMAVLMARRLHREGVRIFMYHGRSLNEDPDRFSHAKVALIDDWAGVGSSNLDRRSFLFHLESLVFHKNPRFLTEMEAFFADLHAQSVPFDETIFRAGPRAYLLYPFRHWL